MPDGVSWSVYATISLLSSVLPVVITNPLDVMKTRLQSRRRGDLACSPGQMLKREGLRGVQLGCTLSVLGHSVAPCCKMCSYQALAALGVDNPALRGAVTGITTAALTSPIWVLKTRTMLTPDSRIGDIFKETGLRGFYTGVVPSCLNKSLEFCVFFATYEWLKTMSVREDDHFNLGLAGVMGSAGLARLVATVVAYPVQVMTTRIREPCSWGGDRGAASVAKELFRQRALYNGLLPHLLKAVPFSSLYFVGHEFLMTSYRANTM